MLYPGTVYYCPNYCLPDGTLHDTWFVALTSPGLRLPALSIKATSNGERFGLPGFGCNIRERCFNVPNHLEYGFTLPSYLILPDLHRLSFHRYLQYRDQKKIFIKGKLDKECLTSLLNCLEKFEDDINRDEDLTLFPVPF